MTTVFDVAKYILEKKGSMTAMKLQKLVYYSQAWSLVWDETPLFSEKIQAWKNGPVTQELYDWHKGLFLVSDDDRLSSKCNNDLTGTQRETIDKVLDGYSKYTAQALSDITHKEDPWRLANATCEQPDMCDAEITLASMHEYYSGIAEIDE